MRSEQNVQLRQMYTGWTPDMLISVHFIQGVLKKVLKAHYFELTKTKGKVLKFV